MKCINTYILQNLGTKAMWDTLECNVQSTGNEVPWVMFGGAHGLTVKWYYKGHTKYKVPALDTEYADDAQRMHAKNRTSEAQEIIDTSRNLDLWCTGHGHARS